MNKIQSIHFKEVKKEETSCTSCEKDEKGILFFYIKRGNI